MRNIDPIWVILGVVVLCLAGLFGYLYWDSKTPDAYINGRPVEFVDVCISGHTSIMPITHVHSNGKSTWTSVSIVPVFVCDRHRTDTVYMKIDNE